jgi:hypothetical protein
MISVFKISTRDLLRHPDVTWHLSLISQDIEELTDSFMFIIDTSKVYSFIQQLRRYSMSYEAYINPGVSATLFRESETVNAIDPAFMEN